MRTVLGVPAPFKGPQLGLEDDGVRKFVIV